ncbi:hypothetical protein [Tissierella praeacuta]|uniref:hypothetical protein n=1 Tax=Tissierella praeacuta TaxID=43131 RepID=UPI0028B0F21A|nr:hypothetical protein [Tissierella praeacuta]
MSNLLCKAVEKIVFSGVNGTILIIPMGILLYIMCGQVKEFVRVTKDILKDDM